MQSAVGWRGADLIAQPPSTEDASEHERACYERNEEVIDALFDLAGAIITVRRLIRGAWTLNRCETPSEHRR